MNTITIITTTVIIILTITINNLTMMTVISDT